MSGSRLLLRLALGFGNQGSGTGSLLCVKEGDVVHDIAGGI